jgi:hypothetical protein
MQVSEARVDSERALPLLKGRPANGRSVVFTKDILFGMNALTLVGFLVMGLSLTLHRTGNAGVPLSIGLMCAGTVDGRHRHLTTSLPASSRAVRWVNSCAGIAA